MHKSLGWSLVSDISSESWILENWCWNLEVEASSRIYQRIVEVNEGKTTLKLLCDNIVTYSNELPAVCILYKNGLHYDSVVTDNYGDAIPNSADFEVIYSAALTTLTNAVAS